MFVESLLNDVNKGQIATNSWLFLYKNSVLAAGMNAWIYGYAAPLLWYLYYSGILPSY